MVRTRAEASYIRVGLYGVVDFQRTKRFVLCCTHFIGSRFEIYSSFRRGTVAKMRRSRSSSDISVDRELESSRSNVSEKRGDPSLGDDEEKAIGLDGIEHSASKEEEIVAPGRSQSHTRRSQDSKGLKRIESHHSRAGADGYTWHHDGDHAQQRPNRVKQGVVTPEPYLVTFDGDADPENPRSMSSLRRWSIVLICAASSLCV